MRCCFDSFRICVTCAARARARATKRPKRQSSLARRPPDFLLPVPAQSPCRPTRAAPPPKPRSGGLGRQPTTPCGVGRQRARAGAAFTKPKSLYNNPFGKSIVCANKHQTKSEGRRSGRGALCGRPMSGASHRSAVGWARRGAGKHCHCKQEDAIARAHHFTQPM